MYIKTDAKDPQFYENDTAKEVIETYFKQYALFLLSKNGEIEDELSKYLIAYAIKKLHANNDVLVAAYNNLNTMDVVVDNLNTMDVVDDNLNTMDVVVDDDDSELDGNTKKIKKKKKKSASS